MTRRTTGVRARTGLMAILAAALIPVGATAQTGPVRVEEDTECRWNDGRETYCELREFELDARSTVEVDGGANGGIAVTGWDEDRIRLVARVQAHSRDGDPRALAEEVEVRTGDVIEADGPRVPRGRSQGWSVSFELQVPRAAALRLQATNGGISLEELTGDVEARTTNGGIDLVGGAGRVRGETTNGGVALELTGRSWDGEGVDLRTTNGGVRILVPEGYSARLETGTVNGGIDLEIPVMVQGRIDRTIRTELGDGGALIRARTTNGGVTVRRR